MSVDLAYIDDCAQARPEWMAEDGAVSSLQEFVWVVHTPLGYVWLAILVLFIWKRTVFTGLWLAAASVCLAGANWVGCNLDDDLYLGQLGGCVGTLSGTYGVLLCASVVGAACAVV